MQLVHDKYLESFDNVFSKSKKRNYYKIYLKIVKYNFEMFERKD